MFRHADPFATDWKAFCPHNRQAQCSQCLTYFLDASARATALMHQSTIFITLSTHICQNPFSKWMAAHAPATAQELL